MRFSIVIFFLLVVFLVACGTSENEKPESTTNIAKPVVSPVDDLVQRKSALAQFNSLEKLFDNQNYLLTQLKDSSYLYFSRLNNYLIYVHNYKLVKGDSADLTIDTIKLNTKNQLVFNWKGKALYLKQTTDYSSDWSIQGTDSTVVQFKKIDQNNLQLLNQEGNKLIMKKTITLSTFLVRSFYDFQHGTKLAFDSVNFTKR